MEEILKRLNSIEQRLTKLERNPFDMTKEEKKQFKDSINNGLEDMYYKMWGDDIYSRYLEIKEKRGI
jgi:hypothetical protein